MLTSVKCTERVPLADLTPKPVSEPDDVCSVDPELERPSESDRPSQFSQGTENCATESTEADRTPVHASEDEGPSTSSGRAAGSDPLTKPQLLPHERAALSALREPIRSESVTEDGGATETRPTTFKERTKSIATTATCYALCTLVQGGSWPGSDVLGAQNESPQARNRHEHARSNAAAAWLGVAIAAAALSIAIYYGIPMLRLARWTALKDFREACMQEREHGMYSRRCNETLAKPMKSPPVVKRGQDVMIAGLSNDWLEATITAYACLVTLVLVVVWFKPYILPRERNRVSLARSSVFDRGTSSHQDFLGHAGHASSRKLGPRVFVDHNDDADSRSSDSSSVNPKPQEDSYKAVSKNLRKTLPPENRKIANLQDQVLNAHLALDHGRNAFKVELQDINESVSRLDDLLLEMQDDINIADDRNAWKSTREKYSRDRTALEDRLQMLELQESKLVDLIYRLTRLEPRALRVLDELLKEKNDVGREHSGSSAVSRASSPQPESLSQYSDKQQENVRSLNDQRLELNRSIDTTDVELCTERGGSMQAPRTMQRHRLEYEAKQREIQASELEAKAALLRRPRLRVHSFDESRAFPRQASHESYRRSRSARPYTVGELSSYDDCLWRTT